MEKAVAGEMAGVLETPGLDRKFRAVLENAIDAIAGAESFERPYPLILFRDFFPADFYRRLLGRFPDVERFAGLNGDGTRREYALYDELSDPGSDEAREIWGIVRRVLCSPEIASALRAKLERGFRIRSRRSGEGLADPDASPAGPLHRP